MYKWKDNLKHPGYDVPKANVDHTISGNCCQHLRPLGHQTKGKTIQYAMNIMVQRVELLLI